MGPICCSTQSQDNLSHYPVVAMTFTELLERLLTAKHQPYWDQPDFVAYGNAGDHMDR